MRQKNPPAVMRLDASLSPPLRSHKIGSGDTVQLQKPVGSIGAPPSGTGARTNTTVSCMRGNVNVPTPKSHTVKRFSTPRRTDILDKPGFHHARPLQPLYMPVYPGDAAWRLSASRGGMTRNGSHISAESKEMSIRKLAQP
ncbi:uncharacterized protein MONBRDRAFT_25660 [Monosiga brevicollis MX1]|uniref:Uncharacterized protein n=1 Tax=Monosiga brevicollis TaxID=81824 RepID=A9V019_MONBE|nr:uncharacterized protein MONBRDRAFT_25660 [Monosiga brevicollis MX1]EDQ89079.1 predicted protein [Monosiga brevicollis MX1]|eukprot:XP_001746184.1 hypothetical protein [Monosiga brevicollis MX1]